MKVCRRCGKKLPDHMRYCNVCGAMLDDLSMPAGKAGPKENKALTIGVASGISFMLVVIFCLSMFALGESGKYYLASGKTDQTVEKESDDEDTSGDDSSGSIAFTSNIYEVEANKDVDMSKYLQCSGVEIEDINWSSDSDKMFVGSNGHVSLHENGIECYLTAVSKTDEEVKAQCQLKTRTEEEDLIYQVEALNSQAHSEDEEIDGGIIRLAYDNEGSQMIDLNGLNYEPGERNDSYVWDRTLFYTLEDIDLSSNSDGKINSYYIEKKQFINKETGNDMEYEIYRNPDTDVINKIVSIEYEKKKLAINEFYYTDDGLVNFIFSYEDINYTPSYATPSRDGERFRFSHDTLVTWRIVENGSMKNYCYGSDEKEQLEKGYSGKVEKYSDCSEEMQNAYDEKELTMLNLAYNTMEKMENAEGISKISGYVYDASDQGIQGTDVLLSSKDFQCDVFTTTTDDGGYYEIRIPTRDMIYALLFDKTDRIEENICEIDAELDEINLVQETIYMSPEDSSEYECGIGFYDALNRDEEGYGMASVEDVDVEIRRGVNNRDGEIYMSFHAEYSYEAFSLTPGMYTIHTSKSGYLDCYSTLFVSGDTSNYLDVYATPALNEDEIRIVLTWNDDPNDLDSHLFTPSASGLEEDYHICYYNMSDTNGNTSLDVDDTDGYGPETTTINHIQRGLYKFYVCDYTDCSEQNEESNRMSNSGATVRVYGSQGLMQTFNVPVKRNGVIWEVFEIRDGTLIPNQRYYDSIGDKTWWQSGKW